MTSTGVPLRRPAAWQTEPDERLLEALRGKGWASPGTLAAKPNIHLATWMVERRLRMLADAGVVAPLDRDYDLYHLTTEGELYLEGERNQELYPHPASYGRAIESFRVQL